MKSDSADKLHKLLVDLLKPVSRFALERGIKHQDILLAVKQSLVAAAREKLSPEEQTASRISILTGLHRYDVKKLEEQGEHSSTKDPRSLIARILSRWATQRAYCDNRGNPRPLSCDGKDSEFALLVAEISQAVNPYTVLFDLERLNLVEKTEHGLILKSRLLVDRKDIDGGLALLAADSADLHQAICENLYQEAEYPNLHIRTEFDSIPESALPRLRIWLLKMGTKFHERVQRYLAHLDQDESKNGEKHSSAGKVQVSLTSFSLSRLSANTQRKGE